MFQIAVRERVRLIRRREGLQAVKKHRRRKELGQSTPWIYRAVRPDHDWSYDFVHNQTIDGRRFRSLSMVDEFTRENPAIVISRNMASDDVIRALDALIDLRDRPDAYVATRARNSWPRRSGIGRQSEPAVGTHFIDPGSTWQNAYGQSFNSIFRTTCPDRCEFESICEARAVVESWRREYNEFRPHRIVALRAIGQTYEGLDRRLRGGIN